jgi:hypothetical protein
MLEIYNFTVLPNKTQMLKEFEPPDAGGLIFDLGVEPIHRTSKRARPSLFVLVPCWTGSGRAILLKNI